MTSSNGNIFRVTGPLCGQFTGHRPATRSFDVFFYLRLKKKNGWVNNREASDSRRHRAHYNVIVIPKYKKDKLFPVIACSCCPERQESV